MSNHQKGFSLIELLIVVAIILIIAAIAIPNLLSSRMSANESAAVGALRTLNTAAITYSSSYGIGYPAGLANMGPAATASAAAADLIDSSLVTGTKAGYNFAFVGAAPDASGTVDTYTLNADATVQGQTGNRHFYTDQSGVITYAYTAAAGPTDVPLS
jgi:type IV pilus assembly protein PilA